MRQFVRRALVRFLSSPVRSVLPARTRLALHERLGRSQSELELRHLHLLGPNRGVAIDAGANVGMYTLRLSQLYDSVVAFEPNPALACELQDAHLPNVRVIQVALSDAAGKAELRMPLQNGRPLSGWATVEAAEFSSDETASIAVDIARLDDYALGNVTFMKIDVEGHELALMAGAMKTVARDRPILLCEAKGENAAALDELLAPLGYRRGTLKEWLGIEGTEGNWLFAVDPPGRRP
jgi:FkbM family methyltransferase